MKYCPKCKQTKERSEFYVCPSRYNGVRVYCKDCTSYINKTYVLSYVKRRYKTDTNFRDLLKNRSGLFSKKYPEINRAHSMVRFAIQKGTLKPEVCFCGNINTEAHHEDYTRPLDVIWLCGTHHRLANKGKLHF